MIAFLYEINLFLVSVRGVSCRVFFSSFLFFARGIVQRSECYLILWISLHFSVFPMRCRKLCVSAFQFRSCLCLRCVCVEYVLQIVFDEIFALNSFSQMIEKPLSTTTKEQKKKKQANASSEPREEGKKHARRLNSVYRSHQTNAL